MRILIIGGTGFIGPHVVRALQGMGHDLTVFHRGQTEAGLPASVAHLHGDRAQLSAYREELQRLAPEVVVDMKPMTEADARAVMDVFRGVGRRVVAISSGDVYRAYDIFRGSEPGPPEPIPLTEESPLRARLYPYRGSVPRGLDDPSRWIDDYEKILVERVVLSDRSFLGTVLRLPMVYGPGDEQHRLFPYLKRMDDHRPAILLGREQASWCWTRGYVENVGTAIALAVVDDRAAGRVYNVGEATALSEAEWVRAIALAAGWHGKIVTVSHDKLPSKQPQMNFGQHLVMDTTRIRREFGYQEVLSQAETLRRAIAWERAHPPANLDPQDFDYAAEDVLLGRLES